MSEFYLRCAYCTDRLGHDPGEGFSVVVDEDDDVVRFECLRCGGSDVERGREI